MVNSLPVEPVINSTDQASLRQRNLASVMAFVRAHQPTARSEIARRTGLARGSVTGLSSLLIESGLLKELPGERSGPGRPLAPLTLDGSGSAVIAVHIHADDIDLYVADLAEHPLSSFRMAHHSPQGHPELVAQVIADMVMAAAELLLISGITVARLVVVAAAPVLRSPSVIPIAVDLGWSRVDIVELLNERLPPHVYRIDLVNDANMAALAEYRAIEGQAAGITDVVYFKSDTGVGGGVIADGELFTAGNGAAFEPGHLIVLPNGPLCSCGYLGCLAAVAGPETILNSVGLGPMLEKDGLHFALDHLIAGVRGGNEEYRAALIEAGAWIRVAIQSCVRLFNPQQVILGGYWAEIFEFLQIEPMESFYPELLASPQKNYLSIVPGRVGARSSLIGAVSFAVDDLLTNPLAIDASRNIANRS